MILYKTEKAERTYRFGTKEPHVVLSFAGYDPHPKGMLQGYIRQIDDRTRWHAYVENECIVFHLDKTIHGYHNMIASRYKKEELKRFRKAAFNAGVLILHIGVQRQSKPRDILIRKFRTRSVFNPMRYLKSPLYES